jgi:hypothetical protein
LIDDSAENGFTCATAGINTILFGHYSWNQRRAKLGDELSYEERCKQEGSREWWKDDEFELPQGDLPLTRAKTWDDVVALVEGVYHGQ